MLRAQLEAQPPDAPMLHCLPHMRMWTKLRPGVREFLDAAKERCGARPGLAMGWGEGGQATAGRTMAMQHLPRCCAWRAVGVGTIRHPSPPFRPLPPHNAMPQV